MPAGNWAISLRAFPSSRLVVLARDEAETVSATCAHSQGRTPCSFLPITWIVLRVWRLLGQARLLTPEILREIMRFDLGPCRRLTRLLFVIPATMEHLHSLARRTTAL